jgi:hypothetical protein
MINDVTLLEKTKKTNFSLRLRGVEHMKITAISFSSIALLMLMFVSCTPHQKYRTEYSKVCVSQTTELPPDSECEKYALQQLPTSHGANYFLGFIEFDDQGQLWDRKQMSSVLSTLHEKSASHDLLLLVFVHGWKHSAAPGDSNIDTFRDVLAKLADAEASIAEYTGNRERQVAGVYLGWRGGSITWCGLKEFTFWDRKNTAQKVGYGGVAEVLSRLEEIKNNKDNIAYREHHGVSNDSEGYSNTRLVVIGHSFGAAVVYTALAQILENRFIQTTAPNSNVKSFGNLVVLINPAFEANLFTPLSDMAVERGTYSQTQLPVMLVLTSKADEATGKAFPIGRRLSTVFENYNNNHRRYNPVTGQFETISEYGANTCAVGHFKPYRTHSLYPKVKGKREGIKAISGAESLQMFVKSSGEWSNDAPGSIIPFGELQLERTKNSAGRNPYLITYVDGDLIKDHNDINDPRVIEFIKQVILISTHNRKQTKEIQNTLE